jgi:hypothetical protein
MTAMYGMRGAVEEEDLDTPGRTNYTQLMTTALRLTGASEPVIGAPDRQLLFAARMYRCAHCGTRYESLPNLMGAVKCRNCGSNEIGEET